MSKGKLLRQLEAALMGAFPARSNLERMVKFNLDEDLEAIAGAPTYAEVVFKLIEWADARDRIEALLCAAREENAENLGLQDFEERWQEWQAEHNGDEDAAEIHLAVSPPPGAISDFTYKHTHRPPYAPPQNIYHWTQGLLTAANAVCRIELPNTQLTGFLVGPRLVLTAADNISDDKIAMAHFRFDYQFGNDGVTPQEGVVYPIARHAIVDKGEGYALLLVDGSPGTDTIPISNQRRGWLQLSRRGVSIGQNLYALHFVGGRPLRVGHLFSLVATKGLHEEGEKEKTIVYGAHHGLNAAGGSGAPICNLQWEVVAIHRLKGSQLEDREKSADKLLENLPSHPETFAQSVRKGALRTPLLRAGCSSTYVLQQPQVKMALAISNG